MDAVDVALDVEDDVRVTGAEFVCFRGIELDCASGVDDEEMIEFLPVREMTSEEELVSSESMLEFPESRREGIEERGEQALVE